VEVTPPNSASNVGGLTFYTELSSPSGDLAIGPVGSVTATIGATVKSECSYEGPPPARDAFAQSGKTIPAQVSYVPTERVLGVAVNSYVTTTGIGEDWEVGDPYRSTMTLPPGRYDIYVESRAVGPPIPDYNECELPPLLVRGQEISGTVALAVELPTASAFKLVIRGPAGDSSLENWSVAVLDSQSGRVLSVQVPLGSPVPGEHGPEYVKDVEFIPAHVVESGKLEPDAALLGHEVIRLSPPKTVIAPSFYFQRDGLRFSDGPDIIDLTPPSGYGNPASAVPANVIIEGQASERDTGLPVAAAVTLASVEIEGASSQASYSTTIQVDDTGKFTAELPPGRYSVRATPSSELGLSAAETEWQIRASTELQAGKTIELPKAPSISGEAFANGTPLFGATATAVLSPQLVQTTVLERSLGASRPLPRTSADLVGEDGDFAISVDPGRYDFFIRPEARSKYPWLVLPSIEVPEGGLWVDRRRLTHPFVYRGAVMVDATSTRVPGALIRAYVYVTAAGEFTSDISKSAAVISVAETRADESGAFELLIPASLDEL
jgi:hypothetical protein